MPTLNKQSCPTCGQSVNEREIALFRGMVDALWRVFKWCEEQHTHEFTRKDIRHLLGDESSRAHFGDWILFGGLVYRREKKKGHYGINRPRLLDFYTGKLAIPTRIYKNPLTKELRFDDERLIHEIPQLKNFLDEHNEYIAVYKNPIKKDPNGQTKLF